MTATDDARVLIGREVCDAYFVDPQTLAIETTDGNVFNVVAHAPAPDDLGPTLDIECVEFPREYHPPVISPLVRVTCTGQGEYGTYEIHFVRENGQSRWHETDEAGADHIFWRLMQLGSQYRMSDQDWMLPGAWTFTLREEAHNGTQE